MTSILSDICNFNDLVDNFNKGMNNTVSRIQDTGFQLLTRLDQIVVDNREEFINHTKQALLEMFFEAKNKTKQDVLDVIEEFIYNLSNTVESVIEHAKNATTIVVDESLGKFRHEADTFIDRIVTNRFFIMMSLCVIIILFSATGYLYRRFAKEYQWCTQLCEVLSNMILIITSMLICAWFGFALVWFFERAIHDKDPFYIIVTVILIIAVAYGIVHLCLILKAKFLDGWEWLHKKGNKR